MAKITLENGITIEGTAVELAEMVAQITAKADVVESEEVAEDATLKVGDYAKVVDGGGNFSAGTIAKVVKSDGSSVPYKLETLSGVTNWATASRVVKITEEEFASAKAQAEADAIERKKMSVFTDAGRKPNEYREGDIVRVSTRADAHKVAGKLVTIAEFRDTKTCGGLAWFEDYGHSITGQYLEPIAFVENRLDRN